MDIQLLIVTALLGIFGTVIFYVSKIFNKTESLVDQVKDDSKEPAIATDLHSRKKNNSESNQNTSGKKSNGQKTSSGKDKLFDHKWLLTTLKGHQSRVLSMDISPSGKFLASSCENRSLILWPTKHFHNKDHKIVRGNVAFDHGAHLKWSPDGKALIVHKEVSRQIEVYKVIRKEGSNDTYTLQSALEFPTLHQADDDIVALDIDSNGRFMMTCSKNKNDLCLFDLKGALLERLDTFLMTTHYACVSPCGNYVAACGFAPDVKIWTVKAAKGFDKVVRGFECTGHTSGVFHMSWRSDSSHLATISKDQTWKIFKIDPEFQSSNCVSTGKVKNMVVNSSSKVALSPDGKVMAIAQERNVLIYALYPKAEFVTEIENVHTQIINNILFSSCSKWLLTSGDKHIRVFYNYVGFQRNLLDLKQTLEDAVTQGHKDRLKQQIDELTQTLKSIGK